MSKSSHRSSSSSRARGRGKGHASRRAITTTRRRNVKRDRSHRQRPIQSGG
jgi:hypothetical protein